MKILLSKSAGFCFGVRRAVELIEAEIAKGDKEICTLGHIIHNEDFNADLLRRGVKNIDTADLDRLPKDRSLVFIRTHGAPRQTLEQLDKSGISYLDATCPFVKKIHQIVQKESGEDTVILLTGDPDHPEVRGIESYAGGKVVVLPSASDLDEYARTCDKTRRHVLLSQTTHSLSAWKETLAKAREIFPDLAVYDTICSVTEERQNEVEAIAKASDLVVVVGGKNSSNTKKLADAASRYCKTVHIRNASELDTGLIHPEMTVGVTAGASTPDGLIKEVIKTMSEIEKSFEELLAESEQKQKRTGEEVVGIVTHVSGNEVQVDLGIKHTGILPASEVSDNEQDLQSSFKVGDEITVLLQKFNDAEGTVQVSKRRVDSRANLSKVLEAKEAGTVLTGNVVAVIKGGVLVSFDGMNVFVPASLTGLARGADLNELAGKEVSFRIIEVDPARKRAVASIRAVQQEARRAAAEKFWSEVEVDKVYTGKVKSLTSYGAFVDLGGVDGMVHVTELSWQKIKNPAEVVKVGDEITVRVKEINPETKKISLTYKTEAENPWNLIKDQYKAGDVARVRIVNLTPFGAFAEVIPGIDGLIHISQITDHKIAAPGEVLKVGDEVDVQIVDINYETRKVSLSIRALMEPASGEEAAPAAEDEIVASTDAPVEETPAEAPAEEAPAEAPAEEAPAPKKTSTRRKKAAPAEEAPAEEKKPEAE